MCSLPTFFPTFGWVWPLRPNNGKPVTPQGHFNVSMKTGKIQDMRITNIKNTEELIEYLPKHAPDYIPRGYDLWLEDCPELEYLSEELSIKFSITDIAIRNCPKLKSLFRSFKRHETIDRIVIEDCPMLSFLPTDIECLRRLGEFRIRNCGLAFLPEGLNNLERISEFSLINCPNLISIPSNLEISQYHGERFLEVHDCPKLITLPNNVNNVSISGCPNIILPQHLKKVYLTNPSDDFIYQSQNLQEVESIEMRWSGQDISIIPDSIGYLNKTQSLSISNVNAIYLPESIGHLINLKQLSIDGCNNLKFLPNSIGDLDNLKVLEISNCERLESLPENIGNLKNVEELYIRNYHGEHEHHLSIPDSIGNLHSLEKLTIFSGSKPIPINIGNLNSLEELKICNTESLSLIPDSVRNLEQLEELFIRTKQGDTNYSEALLSLSKHCYVDINGEIYGRENESGLEYSTENSWRIHNFELWEKFINYIDDDPQNILKVSGLEIYPSNSGWDINISKIQDILDKAINIHGLTICFIAGLVTLPLEKLQNLRQLYIAGCPDLVLPQSIGCLKNLHRLDLHKCNFTTLPEEIGHLIKLRHLNIDDCPNLIALPERIGNLNKIRGIYMKDLPQFIGIPDSVKYLQKLESVYFENCPMLSEQPEDKIPESIKNRTTIACRRRGRFSRGHSIDIIFPTEISK
jgi:Leucine-rich repeat (LRR) protein